MSNLRQSESGTLFTGRTAGRASSPDPLTELTAAMNTELDGAVPFSLSNLPTVAVKLDLERTLPMEPVVLAQLCAQTQISQRRRILPLGLEYSVHMELAPDLLPPGPGVAPSPTAAVAALAAGPTATVTALATAGPPAAVAALAAGPTATVAALAAAGPPAAVAAARTYHVQLLALLLGPLLGLSAGAGVAWQLGRLAERPLAERAGRPLPAPLAAPRVPPRSLPALPDRSAPSGPQSGSPPGRLQLSPATASPAAAPDRPAVREPARTPALAAPRGVHPVATTAGSQPASPRPSGTAVPEPARVPPPSASGNSTAQAPPQLSPMAHQLYRRETTLGSSRLCVNPSGAVAAVTPVAEPPFDGELLRTLRAWRSTPLASAACIDEERHLQVAD